MFQITNGAAKRNFGQPHFSASGLFTEIERLDDCSVALDIDLFQILQQLAALADQTQQRTLCTEVVFVATKVFRKVVDTEREQRDLALGRTRVGVGLSVLTEKLLLFQLINNPFSKVYLVPLYDAFPLP